jgi:hypothetical protein
MYHLKKEHQIILVKVLKLNSQNKVCLFHQPGIKKMTDIFYKLVINVKLYFI